MPHLPTWRRYFRVMPPAAAARVDEELRFHFEARIEELVADGLSPDEARARAVHEFGDVDRVKTDLRIIDARTRRAHQRAATWHGLGQDVRVSWRSARRTPVFSLIVIATFTLGIGANSVIFSFLSGVLLRPLPYTDPSALVAVWLQNPELGRDRNPLSALEVLNLRSAAAPFAEVEALQANVVPSSLDLSGISVPVQVVRLSPGMFRLLGREALLGRTFNDLDDGIVLSYAFWQRQFGGDRSVTGQRYAVGGGEPVTIAGVMPPDFVFPFASLVAGPVTFTDSIEVDAWLPLDVQRAAAASPTFRNLSVVARARADVGVSTVRTEIARAVSQLGEASPETLEGWSAAVVPLHDQVVGDVRPALRLLLAGVGLMLLVACANVANLLLARGAARTRELAMRAALGAGRLRLLRQTLVESLMLALLGGAAGLIAARWATATVVALAPGEIPRLQSVAVDWRVLAFTAAVTIATGLVVGLAPAIAALGADVRQLLADGSRGTTSGRRTRTRSSLVSAEVALAVVLTLGAALLTRSFTAVLAVDPGFDSDQVLTLSVNVPSRHRTPEARSAFYRQLFDRLAAIPGVVSVGGTTRLPLGGANSTTQIAVDGREPAESLWPQADLRRALGRYFETMRIPIRRGRPFDERDGPAAPPVAIVNETLARRLFPDEDPIGQRIRLGANAGIPVATIVGVAGDIRHHSLEAPAEAEVYIHYLQNPPVAPLIVLRTAGEPAALAPAVRAAVQEVEAGLTVYAVRTLRDVRLETVAERRFFTSLIGAFGVVSLLLAAIGVFGVVALAVAERRQEIGIRLALGATPAQVGGGVLSDALRLAGIGTTVGLVLAVPLMPLMANQLYGVSAADPLTLAAVPLLMMGITALAALVPARRAMCAAPITTLRAD